MQTLKPKPVPPPVNNDLAAEAARQGYSLVPKSSVRLLREANDLLGEFHSKWYHQAPAAALAELAEGLVFLREFIDRLDRHPTAEELAASEAR